MADTQMSATRLLVLVHPGSTCGSADFHHGRMTASSERECLITFLRSWDGPALIIDSDLSDEIGSYPALSMAIEVLLRENADRGHYASRIGASDDMECEIDWVDLASRHIADLRIPNVSLTGAWYHEDDDGGCINAMYDALAEMGIAVDVHDSAFPIDIEQ